MAEQLRRGAGTPSPEPQQPSAEPDPHQVGAPRRRATAGSTTLSRTIAVETTGPTVRAGYACRVFERRLLGTRRGHRRGIRRFVRGLCLRRTAGAAGNVAYWVPLGRPGRGRRPAGDRI